jgi:hypothetical protein
MSDQLELWMTVAILLACIAAAAFLSWLERRPRTSLTPRLIPTTPLLLSAGFIGLLALVHLVNIFGIHTGR